MELYIPRFLDLPKQNCFLFGPRGTGKSTFLQNHLPDALWLDLLKPENYRQYKARPERLEELTLGNPQKKDVVIAEIQRVPELLPLVHRIIEKNRGHRFILTGSSARKLKTTGIDLLGGRAMSSHPKFYFFDAGVFQALRPLSGLLRAPPPPGEGRRGMAVPASDTAGSF